MLLRDPSTPVVTDNATKIGRVLTVQTGDVRLTRGNSPGTGDLPFVRFIRPTIRLALAKNIRVKPIPLQGYRCNELPLDNGRRRVSDLADPVVVLFDRPRVFGEQGNDDEVGVVREVVDEHVDPLCVDGLQRIE